MIDSNSIIESGVNNGNLLFLGSFDECLSVHITGNDVPDNMSRLVQYCTVQFPIQLVLSPNQVRK